MHGYNTTLPKPKGTPEAHPDDAENHLFAGKQNFSLASAMTSMLALGIPLAKVVAMVTSAPAAMLRLADQIGTLKPGMVADVSVLEDIRGRFLLEDNEGTQITAPRFLRPAFCLRAGMRFDATAEVLPHPVLTAA
jgi:dihydroorotase